jgi:hypothetical protein
MSGVEIDRRTLISSIAATGVAVMATGQAAGAEKIENAAIVTAAAAAVRAQYVDPEMANRLADHLLARLASGAYETNSSGKLAARLTADLRALTNDLHMQVVYEPPVPSKENPSAITEDTMHPRTTG